MVESAIFVILIGLLFFALMSFWSNFMKSPNIGLEDGKLKRCSSSPNCICSEYNEDQTHYIEFIHLIKEGAEAREQAAAALEVMGGVVQVLSINYIHATFKTPVFRFVDDLEIRFTDNRQLHIRSASRVGYSDLGKNKSRALEFRRIFQALVTAQITK